MPVVHKYIDPDSLAGRIIALRLAMTPPLNQRELARAAHVDQSTMSEIEGGNTLNPSGRVLVNLALVLGTTARYLLDGMDGDPDDIRAVTEICTALNPPARAAWIAVGRAMMGDGRSGKSEPRAKPPRKLDPRKPPRSH